jgi:ribosome maturation factor RimP
MQTSANGASGDRFIREAGLSAEVASVVEPMLEAHGFRLVRIEISGRDGKTVQIMAERPDGTMTIEDCESISRELSPLLDVCDILSESYRLEVSSPGIDRPLVRPSDFENWSGYEAKLELREPVDGRRRFRGRLEGFDDGEIRIEVDLGEDGPKLIGVPLGLVTAAKLVLTDELVREALARAKQKGKTGLGDGAEADPEDLEE